MSKVILTYSNPSFRMSYALKIIFKVCLGVDCKIESIEGDGSSYTISSGDKSVSCPVHPISLSQDEIAKSSGVKWTELSGIHYPCEVLGSTDILFDPLAAVVYLACGWDEMFLDDVEFDKHGRAFCSNEEFYKNPVIENIAEFFAEKLELKRCSTYSFVPTIDVDVAYAFKGRGAIHSLLASLRDLVLFRWSTLRDRVSTVFSNSPDPYDTYEWITGVHKLHGLNTTAFFLHAPFIRPYDVGLPKKVVSKIMDGLSDKWSVNWHPSYSAISSLNNGSHDGFEQEKNDFPYEVKKVRAHFLRMSPLNWSRLSQMGVEHDYSMGFAGNLQSFKTGLCRPYPAYDLKSDKELSLTIHPVSVMDSTLKSYSSLSTQQAISEVKSINDTVRRFNGTMYTIWHNTSVSDYGEWKGWREVYEKVIEICSD